MVDLKTGNPLPFGTLGVHKVYIACIMCTVHTVILTYVHMYEVYCNFWSFRPFSPRTINYSTTY